MALLSVVSGAFAVCGESKEKATKPPTITTMTTTTLMRIFTRIILT